jgi:serine/threonine protein kinase
LSEGTVIPFGKYELLERLGMGGMAIVYRARYTAAPGITKPVVIKKVLDVYAGDPAFVEQFIQEARICVGLNHGNIVQVFDFGQVEGEYFLAMELVEGQPLSKVLKQAQNAGLAPLPAPLAVSIAIEMCKGLHHAHTRTDEKGRPLGLVHRDVSPDNVLISYEGEVKISDFGVAKAQYAGRPETEAGMVKGKYLFFSPEQAMGEALDARSDVYAMGVVLFRMLCGRLPVEGPEVAVMQRIVQGKLTPPLQLNPQLDPGLVDILDEALAHEREDRSASAEALHQRLSHWLVTRAPQFTGNTLKHMMGWLYEQQLTELGRPPQLSARFREQMARLSASQRWRELAAEQLESQPTLAPKKEQKEQKEHKEQKEQPVSLATAPSLPPVAEVRTQETATMPNAQLEQPKKKPRSKWRVAAAVVVLLGVAGLVVVRVRAPPLEVRSEPPGAQVIIDGVAVGMTPLKLDSLVRDAPHKVEVNLRGMRTWSHPFEPKTLQARLDVTLEPVPPLPPPPVPPPQPAPAAGTAAEVSPAPLSVTEGAPAHFTLQEKWHSFSTMARSLQQPLDAGHSYTVWTSGSYTGDAPISEQDLRQGLSPASARSDHIYVFLEGESVPAAERLFMASVRPHTLSKARVLHAFVLVGITADRNVDRNLTLHVRDNTSKQVVHLRLEARRFAHQVALENRYSVRGLDPDSWYAVEITPHESAPVSAVAVLVVAKAVARVQLSGQVAGEVRYAFAPGRYVMQGARELWFALPRSEDDGEAQMEVSLVKTTPPPPAPPPPPVEEISPAEAEEREPEVGEQAP